MAKQTPIPQNPIGENFVWRDWFQRLSDRVFGTAAAIDVPIQPEYGGTGLTTYNTGDMIYSNATNNLTRLAGPAAKAYLTMSSLGVPAWKVPRYGAFHDTTNQTAAANTPTAITYNHTDISSGVSLGSPASRVVIDTAGLYNLQFSIQFANTTASIDDVVVWFKVNGTDVSNSASWVSVTAKHGGVDGTGLMALNFFYEFTANQYFELWWMSVGGHASLGTIPLSVSPSYPESPSIILTVSDNIKA
jgi:hypothetical protein